MKLRTIGSILLLCAAGCAGKGASSPSEVTLAFPPVHDAAGGEVLGKCQSWTLNNDQPLYFNKVTMAAGPGWHHSNWFFVPDTMYAGPDGTWDCSSRSFDEFAAATNGGVLFAQSTQTTNDVQAFPSYAAVKIPAHSRIVGGIHLVNASSSAIDTAITLTLDFIPESQATTRLQPMSLAYTPLDLEPHALTEAYGDCTPAGGATLDFKIYYVLPHYHYYGTGMHVAMSGGPLGNVDVFDGTSPIGEPWGKTYDPPLDVTGSNLLHFACDYDNVTDNPLYWGNGGGEMCVLLAFTDSPYKWAGGVLNNGAFTGTNGAMQLESGPCILYSL